jgi:2-oxoglutarate/2-oxoacid ferredoxin oxidoreductase subunit alpha
MKKRYNILFGGPAGTGPNILTHLVGKALVKQGHYAFYARDYQSLIRGGHNFNVLTFSEEQVNSNDSEFDILVALDENTVNLHSKNLKKGGVILSGHDENMYYAGRIFKLLCMDFKILDDELKELSEKRYEENIEHARKGYDEEKVEVCKIVPKKNNGIFVNGNQGISEGAVKSGINVYFAYPMTPATPILGELAEKSSEKGIKVIELENEIAVANAGVGSSITGALTMVGTSGGGFDLMTETLSLTGIAGSPLVFYLSQRPGPGTGVATYSGQGDLNIARHGGHGEFNRVVVAPGDPLESEELVNQAFYFSQKFKIPSIVVSDKHLGEAVYTMEDKPKIVSISDKTELGRYNSYEVDSEGSATEDFEIINKNVEARKKVGEEIIKEAGKFSQYEVYGDKNSENVVISWGSTKGAILDAIKDLDIKFVQIKYIEPFPEKVEKELEGNLILVENSATGQLGDLVREKTGIKIEDKNKILRYDGRPFLRDELNDEINKKLK